MTREAGGSTQDSNGLSLPGTRPAPIPGIEALTH